VLALTNRVICRGQEKATNRGNVKSGLVDDDETDDIWDGLEPKLTDHEQAEALKRLAAGESCRSIARTMAVHHATVARLAS
jgi:Helix-turn-helix domain